MLFSAGLTAALGRATRGDLLSKLWSANQEASASISVTKRDVRVDDKETKVLEGNHVDFQQTQRSSAL